MKDDRSDFEIARRNNVRAMGEDVALNQNAIDIIVESEKHRYSYLWTWLGLPIIQYPADIVATQEIIWKNRPDVIIETGVARGGSVVFLASMLKIIGGSKVIGVDIDIRKHNRDSIENHLVADIITLVEGSSTKSETLSRIKAQIPDKSKVMVILDSNHSATHVAQELELYSELVTVGQSLIVADTILGFLSPEQTPRERADVWLPGNEPLAAVRDFLSWNKNFAIDEGINDKMILSSSKGGYLRRVQ